MSLCIVHFGMHKTGSSSIQQSLFRNLRDPRFHYLHGGVANQSGLIASLFKQQPEAYHAFEQRGLSGRELARLQARQREALQKSIDQCAHRTAIFSGEDVCHLQVPELEALRDFLLRHFDLIQVVGYVRTPVSYAESAFQQRLKSGHWQSRPQSLLPGYRRRFERLDQVFGSGAVKFWKFETTAFPEGDVVLDFCRRLGIDLAPEDSLRINEGLSRDAIGLLYCLHRHGPGAGVGKGVAKVNRMLLEQLLALRGPKLKFSSVLLHAALEASTADVEWMERRMGASLDEVDASDEAGSLQSFDDLQEVKPATLNWLSSVLGRELPGADAAPSPSDVAGWMHDLRMKLGGVTPETWRSSFGGKSIGINTKGSDDMKLNELLDKVRINNPEVMRGLRDPKALALLRATFKQLRDELDGTSEGAVPVVGLGRFAVKQVEREKDGQTITVKRIVFHPAKPQAAKAEDAEASQPE